MKKVEILLGIAQVFALLALCSSAIVLISIILKLGVGG